MSQMSQKRTLGAQAIQRLFLTHCGGQEWQLGLHPI